MENLNSEQLRLCYTCGIEKPHEEMVKGKGRKDGIRSLCKECRRRISRQIREKRALSEGREIMPYKEKVYSHLSDDELLSFLKKFQQTYKRPPTAGDLDGLQDYPHYRTFYRRFNFTTLDGRKRNWNDILQLADVSPMNQQQLWIAWEYLVTLACEALYKECLYQPGTIIPNARPDIVVEKQKLIIDAATSNYIHRHKQQQYEKAVKEGYRVEYWCLYKTSKHGIEGVALTYVFVDEIIERLTEIAAMDLVNQMQNLFEQHKLYADEVIEFKRNYIKGKLQEAYQSLGRAPRIDELSTIPGMPSAHQINYVFSTYNEALKFAEIPIGRKTIPIYKEDTAIQELVALSNRLGKVPTYTELNAAKLTYSCKVYKKYFGGIRSCLKQQGINIDVLDATYKEKEHQNILAEIIKFYQQNNRMPTGKDFKENKHLPSHNWVLKYYGGIGGLKEKVVEMVGC